MKPISASQIFRRPAVLLALAASGLALSSCTTGPVDHVSFGTGYDPGHGSAWGSWEGRGHEGHGRDAHGGHDGRPEREGRPGGSGGIWSGPLPWPDGLPRPDAGSTSVFRDPGIRLADPSIAGRLSPEPRGVEPGRFRPDVRVVNPDALRASLRPVPRPADSFRLRPDMAISPAATGGLRLATPVPAPAVRPASTLRVNPAILRSAGMGSTSGLRLVP